MPCTSRFAMLCPMALVLCSRVLVLDTLACLFTPPMLQPSAEGSPNGPGLILTRRHLCLAALPDDLHIFSMGP